MNLYISPVDYLRTPTGIYDASSTLMGNNVKLSAPALVGATSLSVSALTVAQDTGDRFVIFDGPASEEVTLTAPASVGATSLSVSATTSAHGSGVALCSDGAQGSLAEIIIDASAEIESYCHQSLLQASNSGEKLPLRTTRAAISRDYELVIRPKQFPVVSVASISLAYGGVTTALSIANAVIDANEQTIVIPGVTYDRTAPGYVLLDYTAGYAYADLPRDVKRAATLLTTAFISERENPAGAVEVQLGKRRLRWGDQLKAQNPLISKAYQYLSRYQQKWM